MRNYFAGKGLKIKILTALAVIAGVSVSGVGAMDEHAYPHNPHAPVPCNTGSVTSSVSASNNVDTNAYNIIKVKGKNSTVNVSNDVTTNAINDIYLKGSVKNVTTTNNVSTDASNIIYIKGKNATVNASNNVTTNAVNQVAVK